MEGLEERLENIEKYLIYASTLTYHLLAILYLSDTKSPEIEELYKQILVSRLDIGKIKESTFQKQEVDVTN